jgi:hypothetical protein
MDPTSLKATISRRRAVLLSSQTTFLILPKKGARLATLKPSMTPL